MANNFFEFHAESIVGEPIEFSDYTDRVSLVVNVASKCGFTPQYRGLEKLYKQYKDQGLVILGFPCNQFGNQEPGDAEAISKFCTTTYDVSFPMFRKIEVNGSNAHPLYRWMKSEKPGLGGSRSIKWNFTKFLIDRKGQVVARFGPQDKPEKLGAHIERIL